MSPVLVVIGDSLSFHGPERAEPADDERLWPHVAARAAGGRAELHAGLGWTARHAWRAMVGDPRLWASLRRADAVVLGVGGVDTLPSPVPTVLREAIPALRPARVRQAARAAYGWITPRAARRLGPACPLVLPAAETVRHLELLRQAVHTLLPAVPVVALLPAVHRAPSYGGMHAGRAGHVDAMTAWARTRAVTLVDPAPLVADHVLGGHGNPDGLHWGWPAHRAVGEAVGGAVVADLAAR